MLKKGFYVAALLFAALLGAGKAWIDAQINQQLQQAARQLPPGWQIEYASAVLTWPGAIQINELKLQQQGELRLRARQLRLHQAYRLALAQSMPPPQVAISAQDVEYFPQWPSQASMPEMMKTLGYGAYYLSPKEWGALGYQSLNVSQLDAQLQQQETQTQIQLSLQSASLGDVQLDSQWRNIPWQQLQFWSRYAQCEQLQLIYQNPVPLRRAAQQLANRQQQSAQQVQNRLAEQLGNDLQQSGLKLPADSLQAVQLFLRQPRQIILSLTPQTPITVDTLTRHLPSEWTRLLGLSIQVETRE